MPDALYLADPFLSRVPLSEVSVGDLLTDDGIQQVLAMMTRVEIELVEIKRNVAAATQHFGDFDALQIDVAAIKKHLGKIDGIIAALEKKQVEGQAKDAKGIADAGTADDPEH